MPAVKFFARLDIDQIFRFMARHFLERFWQNADTCVMRIPRLEGVLMGTAPLFGIRNLWHSKRLQGAVGDGAGHADVLFRTSNARERSRCGAL